ncbi:MAG: hypothetical protein IAE82_09020 [Opitutaceae bacterium]|nr:hypothetical protein [Opitutaceae bacterium]
MTLVEVMVATAIFTILATGLTAAYIQNMRMAKAQAYRTQAINTAMTVLEQLRANGYSDLRTNFHAPPSPPPFVIKLLDPSQTTIEPTGYRDFELPINVRDGAELTDTWTETALQIEAADSAPRLPMRFWLTLDRDAAETGDIHAVFQLTLFYQWSTPGSNGADWKTGNLRMAVPKLTVGTTDI